MTYAELNIIQKIELKGLLAEWGKITKERLQGSLERSVYSRQVPRAQRRTRRLYSDWEQKESGGIDQPQYTLTSLYYGRFVEQGVGRGRKKGSDKARARAVRWLTPVKNRELAKLSQLLLKRYNLITLGVAQQYVSHQITLIF